MSTVEVSEKQSTNHDASALSLCILEALCRDDEFSILRETLRLYKEEIEGLIQ
jgi:hypothetical protein